MVKIFPSANSYDEECLVAEASYLARSGRSEARASRWIKPEPRVDAGGNRLSNSSERLAAQRALRGGRGTSPGRTGSSNRRALRRRTLARQFCGLSDHAA